MRRWLVFAFALEACTAAHPGSAPERTPIAWAPPQSASNPCAAAVASASGCPPTLAKSPPNPFADFPLRHEVLVDPDANQGDASNTKLDAVLAPIAGLPAPKRQCLSRMVKLQHTPCADCSDANLAWSRLAEALASNDVATRDVELWRLEAHSEFPPGLVRALRAELDPACGDVIIEPLLAASKLRLSAPWATTLVGLAYAARLQRAVAPLPPLKGRPTPSDLERFLKQDFTQWRAAQVERLRAFETRLDSIPANSYGRAVATLALAGAWYELKAVARRTSIPDSVKRDYELRTRYYGTIDDALEDTQQHARDLSIPAATLASLHGIRRSALANAWDSGLTGVSSHCPYPRSVAELLLPPPPAYPTETAKERAAYRLPPHFAGALFGENDIENPRIIRGLLDNGLPLAHRVLWAKRPPGGENAVLLAFGRLGLARRTLDPTHYDEALWVSEMVPEHLRNSDELRLLFAMAMAARTGPRTVANICDPSFPALHLEALEGLGNQEGSRPIQAVALWNRLWLLRLLGKAEQEYEIARLWQEARRLAEGTAAEPCIDPPPTWLLARHSKPRVCTFVDRL